MIIKTPKTQIQRGLLQPLTDVIIENEAETRGDERAS